MSHFTIALFMLWASSSAFAFDGKSAHREPGESYLIYKYRALRLAHPRANQMSAQDAAKPYGSVNLPEATAWPSEQFMQQKFQDVRDYRWLELQDKPGFLRRISWLYPDDGCFARAGLAIMNFFKWKVPTPSKIFVFGDLTVHTNNAPSGSVSWWYHVAPIVEVSKRKYVLDPALDPKQPLQLEVWLAKMNSRIQNLEVAICNSGAYTPDTACAQASDGQETAANGDEPGYLSEEWQRIEDLQRIPESELGDKPPWL